MLCRSWYGLGGAVPPSLPAVGICQFVPFAERSMCHVCSYKATVGLPDRPSRFWGRQTLNRQPFLEVPQRIPIEDIKPDHGN